jgi:SAM-dependent methyltransferase
MEQQRQAKTYFDSVANEWQAKAIGRPDEYPLIEMRHRAVHSVISNTDGVGRFLDVGCGTGQLAIEVADRGVDAIGIDFAAEMIKTCELNRGDRSNPSFVCGSIFDFDAPAESCDVISAQGFVEYVSPDEMEKFFALANRLLRNGGSLAVGSRNRLFNISSFNDYTLMERDLGVLDALIEEAVAVSRASNAAEVLSAITRFQKAQPQPIQHPSTGIGVSVRYQYAPSDFAFRAKKHGFEPRCIYPVHFHGLPMQIKNSHPEVHSGLAMKIETLKDSSACILPFSSTYLMDLRKVA